MSLRDALLLAGISDRDLESAVRDARAVTRLVAKLSGAAENVLGTVAEKAYLGNRTRRVAILGSTVARTIREGASTMLKTSRVEAPPSPRSPSENLKK